MTDINTELVDRLKARLAPTFGVSETERVDNLTAHRWAVSEFAGRMTITERMEIMAAAGAATHRMRAIEAKARALRATFYRGEP